MRMGPYLQRRSKLGLALLLPVLFIYGNNASWVSKAPRGSPTVLVHRGMSQRYDLTDRGQNRCEAQRMLEPEHRYLENTIPSIEAAFERGADVVEFDVRLTRDDRFVVFHDGALECRTDGRGLTREHTLAELQALDVGYGYTADGGQTYPFRGQGVGMMPSIEEVFETFPRESFLIDVKGNAADGALLGTYLADLSAEFRSRLMVFGREDTLEGLRGALPEMKAFSVSSIQGCLLRYIGYGWTGVVPEVCRESPIFVPINVAPFLWGWPGRFMDRMSAAGASIVAIGPFGQGGISPGVDTVEDWNRLPADFAGGIWTNDVELIRNELTRSEGR